VGEEDLKLHSNVLLEMTKDPYNKVDTRYVQMCIEANQHNCLTSYYFLLAKKMQVAGEALDIDKPPTREELEKL